VGELKGEERERDELAVRKTRVSWRMSCWKPTWGVFSFGQTASRSGRSTLLFLLCWEGCGRQPLPEPSSSFSDGKKTLHGGPLSIAGGFIYPVDCRANLVQAIQG